MTGLTRAYLELVGVTLFVLGMFWLVEFIAT